MTHVIWLATNVRCQPITMQLTRHAAAVTTFLRVERSSLITWPAPLYSGRPYLTVATSLATWVTWRSLCVRRSVQRSATCKYTRDRFDRWTPINLATMSATEAAPIYSPFFGVMGAASAIVFSGEFRLFATSWSWRHWRQWNYEAA